MTKFWKEEENFEYSNIPGYYNSALFLFHLLTGNK